MYVNLLHTEQCKNIPNVIVKWQALLQHIWEVKSLNLGPQTSYSDISQSFTQSFKANTTSIHIHSTLSLTNHPTFDMI